MRSGLASPAVPAEQHLDALRKGLQGCLILLGEDRLPRLEPHARLISVRELDASGFKPRRVDAELGIVHPHLARPRGQAPAID